MGGYGSGGHNLQGRPTVEQLAAFRVWECVPRGTPEGSRAEFRSPPGVDPPWSVEVRIQWTACRFGGIRPWFVCPRCGRWVGVLLAAGQRLACRLCWRATYTSTRERRYFRAVRRQAKLFARIEARMGPGTERHYPPRPRGMRRRTYERLIGRANAAIEEVNAALGDDMGRLVARMERWKRRERTPRRRRRHQ